MMENSKKYQPIASACDELLNEIGCDFVGFAYQNSIGPDIRWHFAAGNCNEKYKRITVRYGKGIAGRVISTGRPMSIQDFPNHIIGKALEYPIMLAEKLLYSYAVPINYKGIPKGVLLVGRRTNQAILESEQIVVVESARKLEKILDSLL